jgi:hypothetical protein
MPDMRFAPPKQLRIADRTDGLNPERVRSYNERLVLSLLLVNDEISRLEIGVRTKLSAQTVSVIVRSLEHEGLLSRGEAMRGRVGPPTIPISLNPNGAFSVGVDLAPWQSEVVLIDFLGGVRFRAEIPPGTAAGPATSDPIHRAIQRALEELSTEDRARVTGIGLAIPENSQALSTQTTASADELSLQRDLELRFGLPVFIQNDITAAAGAEMLFGATKHANDHLYFYLGAALHSRLVLNNHVYTGNYEVAPTSVDVGILALQKRAVRERGSQLDLHDDSDWKDLGETLDRWRSDCVGALKQSTRAIAQFVDIRAVVLATSVPQHVIDAICADLQRAVPELKVERGSVRTAPKAVGAGSLPLFSRFTVQS